MDIQLIRHATLIISIAGRIILVDPMFDPARATDPIVQTPNPRRNPLVELPFEKATLDGVLEKVDALIVTHLHNDHWDKTAREVLPKSLPLFCQVEDRSRIEEAGFQDVRPVADSAAWEDVRIIRTNGQHGRGEIGQLMAPVSGFVLKAAGEPVIYIAGDTIWCEDVEEAIAGHEPDVIVVNAGAAQFLEGDPITMSGGDVAAVAQVTPQATVIAVHMEAINHCLLTRAGLREVVDAAGVGGQVRIPEDGEVV